MTVSASLGAAMDDTPLLPGIRREKGKCRVFNMSCIELPPLSTCRGVSLGGCLCESLTSVKGGREFVSS